VSIDTSEREFELRGEPGAMVSSIRVMANGHHALISVWNRGALAGTLTVNASDADAIATRLLGGER
jgi:hypothetical protein